MPRPLWSTQNDLAEKVRRDVVDLLSQQLADALALGLQAKQAHWNVKGPSFIALHELFDEVHAQVVAFADDIAERAVALGGTALGTAPTIAKASRLPEYPGDIDSGRRHVAALSAAIATFGAAARAAIDATASVGDADTADLFTGISRGADKLLWTVEAHLQGKD